MLPDGNRFCEQHFEVVKHIGVTERALKDIDEKINKIFNLIEKGREIAGEQDSNIQGLRAYVKAYGFQIIIALSLFSIAIKLWSK